MLEAELPLKPFKILTPMLDQKLCRMGFVGAVGHIAVELRRPGHEGVANVLRHGLVLLQGLEKKRDENWSFTAPSYSKFNPKSIYNYLKIAFRLFS